MEIIDRLPGEATGVEVAAGSGSTGTHANKTEIVDLSVGGMTCASCVSRVEKSLMKAEGVTDVAVNLALNRARVKTEGEVPLERLVDRVERAGYTAGLRDDAGRGSADDDSSGWTRVFAAVGIAAVVAAIGMAPMVVPGLQETVAPYQRWINVVQFVLTSFVLFVPGREFFVLTVRTLRHGSADMNTLVAVGTGAAWLFSTIVTFFPDALPGVESHEVYFETAAVVSSLILLGRWLEHRAKRQASEAVRALATLAPKISHRIVGDSPGKESIEDVETDFVHVGDRLLVRPGENVPVDGTVLEGEPDLDESMMTGESKPVQKTTGEDVTGGTVNLGSGFTMRAGGVGDDTVLAGIMRIVDEAQSSKAPVQRLADKVAGIFVPIVLLIALITFVLWITAGGAGISLALVHAVAVLVIACPCAMGLAVPTAVMVGTGRGARRGILIRNAEALERAGALDVVVLDKTGTLTHGKPEVTAVRTFGSIDERSLAAMAAALEQRSEHPLAASIVRYATARGLSLPAVEDVVSTPGVGIEGRAGGYAIRIGRHVEISEELIAEAEAPPGSGLVWVEVDGGIAGVFVVADTIREDAPRAIAELKLLGLETLMLTGDAESTARFVADRIGIDRVIAGVLPDQKGEALKEVQGEGKSVAMVGDGVNDAPALAMADVSLAMSTGSDVAMSTADITILGDELMRVPDAVRLSKRTMRIIRQNLFWAFIYNAVGIPLAAFGLLNPMIAGAAMAFSSVSVVTNSLRLKR